MAEKNRHLVCFNPDLRGLMPITHIDQVKERFHKGDVFRIVENVQDDIMRKAIKRAVRLVCAGVYPHIAAFEDEHGLLRTYRWWDLKKMAEKGELVRDDLQGED